jgi:hypothetical protein
MRMDHIEPLSFEGASHDGADALDFGTKQQAMPAPQYVGESKLDTCLIRWPTGHLACRAYGSENPLRTYVLAQMTNEVKIQRMLREPPRDVQQPQEEPLSSKRVVRMHA